MKRISFKVAKIIKEIGYPQERPSSFYVSKEYKDFDIGILYDATKCYVPIEYRVNAPTYMEFWLWLWREKNIKMPIGYHKETFIVADEINMIEFYSKNDPEEVIIAAIEYLVDNNLIK